VAKGLTASLERIATIIEGADSTAGWTRSELRLTTLQGDQTQAAGIDHKYWLGSTPQRNQPAAIAGSLLTMRYTVIIELARYWGGGNKLDKDYYGLVRSLEAEANIIEQTVMLPNNWDKDNTGIILINMPKPTAIREPTAAQPILLWVITLEVTIRQPKVAATVS
jgi:hypothetical protein